MNDSVTEHEEQYIDEAVRMKLGQREEADETERVQRVRFWQGRSSEDRFQATFEIGKRVHLARGGNLTDLRSARNFDQNKN